MSAAPAETRPGRPGRALLTEGPVGRRLAGLAGPMMIGMLGMVAFNAVDTFFVGRLGTVPLAAVSFTFPVVMIVHSVAMGLGMGATAVISAAIGARNRERVRRLTTDALLLAVLVVLVVSLAGVLTVAPLFRLLGADEALLPYLEQYMTVWYLGMPVVIVPMVGNSALRAAGDTRTPTLIMLVAAVANVILDPLLMFGPGPFPAWGVRGAAVATVGARGLALAASLWILIRREKMVDLAPAPLAEVTRSFRRILHVGIPATGTSLIVPMAMAVLTRMVAGFGVAAVAGFGVATRVEMVAVMVIGSLSSVLVPFVGQNRGGGRPDRVRRAVAVSYRFALLWGTASFLLMLPLARPLAALFDENAEVVAAAALYLHLVTASHGLQGVGMLASSTFNALNRPLPALALSAVRMLGLYLPLAWLGSRFFGLAGLFGGAALGNALTGIVSYVWLRRVLRGLPEGARDEAEAAGNASHPDRATRPLATG